MDTLTEDEFRKALFESLNKKGIVSSFKSHLRQQLAEQLSLRTKGISKGVASQAALVGDMLTAAHLKHSQYEYSLSTFLSEANISDKELSETEWLRLLRVSEGSSLSRHLDKENKAARSPLLNFLEALVKSCGNGIENIGVQTEAVTLQDKFHMLDEKYAALPAETFLSGQERQLHTLYQDNKNVQELVKLEVDRFKELELERYKLKERDRVNKEFNRKLTEYETEYRQRLDSLHRRELDNSRAIDKLKAETGAALFKERQGLLGELESLRARSGQLERENSLAKSQVSLEQEKLAILGARLEERENTIVEKEADFKNKLQEFTEKARLQCKAELRDREGKIVRQESQLHEEQEENIRTQTALESHREELKKLRNETHNLNDKILLLEAQLDAARSQALHYEAKLTVCSDYQQIKERVVSMETERYQLLESMGKERSLGKQSETQLQEIIASLREQLNRPSRAEADAINQLTKLKHKNFSDVEELKNQVSKLEHELEREQKTRMSAQTELREQFLECRSHHAVAQTKPSVTEMPDFLRKYTSAVRLDEDPSLEEDLTDHSTRLLSDTSSDSVLRPTRSIVAGSRRLFDQLEQEEERLEREFAQFASANPAQFASSQPTQFASSNPTQSAQPAVSTSSNLAPRRGIESGQGRLPSSYVQEESHPQINTRPSSAGPLDHVTHDKQRAVTFAPSKAATSQPITTTEPVTKPTSRLQAQAVTQRKPQKSPSVDLEEEASTITPTGGGRQEPDIMDNLDPIMQQYLDRVIKSKEKAVVAGGSSRSDDIEQVEFDKTDSDFSW